MTIRMGEPREALAIGCAWKDSVGNGLGQGEGTLSIVPAITEVIDDQGQSGWRRFCGCGLWYQRQPKQEAQEWGSA